MGSPPADALYMTPELARTRVSGYPMSLGGRFVVTTNHYSAVIAALVLVLLVVLTWLMSYAAGGSRTAAPHLFYLPVVLAAVRFGRLGVLITALAAGLAAGPILPLDVAAGTSQETLNWLVRVAAFVAIGEVVAFFVHHSKGSIGDELARVVIRRDLRRALEARNLHVVYQPIIDLATDDVVGAETLVRWTDPDRGPIAPAEFVPVAEDAGVAHLISEFVFSEAARQLGVWRANGLVVRDQPFMLAVNISGSELRDDHLETLVRNLVVHERIPAEWLHVEVTETALIADLDTAVRGLQRLRGIGIRLAIDDFGTGESSLRYLHQFPVDTLKIDRSFIEPLVGDRRGRYIVQSVIDLAHNIGLLTVAEGVETAEHAEVLRLMGCDLAQGYYFDRPLYPIIFEERLHAQRQGQWSGGD